jgi:hypothetical protein
LVAGSVLLQGFLSLGVARLIKLGLVNILLLIYLFLAVQLVGYLLIAWGSKRLTKIETV